MQRSSKLAIPIEMVSSVIIPGSEMRFGADLFHKLDINIKLSSFNQIYLSWDVIRCLLQQASLSCQYLVSLDILLWYKASIVFPFNH